MDSINLDQYQNVITSASRVYKVGMLDDGVIAFINENVPRTVLLQQNMLANPAFNPYLKMTSNVFPSSKYDLAKAFHLSIGRQLLWLNYWML